MFPSSGLFKNITCPDYPKCQRIVCVFSHTPPRSKHPPSQTGTKRKLKTADAEQSVKKKPVQQETIKQTSRTSSTLPRAVNSAAQASSAARPRISQPTALESRSISSAGSTSRIPTQKPAAAKPAAAKPTAAISAVASGFGTQPSVAPVGGSRRVAHTATFAATPTGPPTIVPALRSHVPLKMRQMISKRVYEQFIRIYAPILPTHPAIATEHAKAQEAEILEKTSNQAGYKQMATNILMNLKKRHVAQDEEDVGIDGAWVDPSLKEKTSAITEEKVTRCVLTKEQLEQMNYPSANALEGGVGETIGSKKKCDRCKAEYVVKDVLQESDLEVCKFHYGRMRMVMSRGEKLRQYTCCDESFGSMGCVRGPHVYKDETTADLHAKVPFVSTPEAGSASEPRAVVALDCEMAYTTAGMELVRLTAIDENCKTLLDELVFPSHMIVDLNTRYSGIQTLAGATHNLESVRKELFKYVDANTILLGHGLENDMNALRLLHPKIIDTVALYPHPKGLPFRYGLRVLSTKILQKFIQDSSDGHDSFEDAKTCVDLLEKYLKSPQGRQL